MRLWFTLGILMAAGVATCQQTPASNNVEQVLDNFTRAVADGRLVGKGGAAELLDQMRGVVPADDWADQRDRLLDNLTRRGSQVVNRYTKGDEVPQQKGDYDQCAELYDAANKLEPSALSEARMWFCRGRSLLEGEQKNFDLAVDDLKKAIQTAPDDGGYHYNALGVAYLEQGKTKEAAEQFQKAVEHDSPSWTYPRHHLALTYIENGDYVAAQREYHEALEMAGNEQQTGYLHYNLGLLAHQLGQRKEAQREYEIALKLFLDQKAQEEGRNALDRAARFQRNAAEAYNALGALWKSEGKRKQAEEAYLKSLKLNPDLEAAQRNLDLLHGRAGKPAKQSP